MRKKLITFVVGRNASKMRQKTNTKKNEQL